MAAAKMSGSEMAAPETVAATVATTACTACEHACRGQHHHAGQNQTDN
jgi:hypothetical protein